MSPTQSQPEPTPDDPDLDTRLTAYLFDLLEIGAKVAQNIGRQADLQAQPTPQAETPHPPIDVAEQFDRVARAMRRTVLLIRHIAQPGTKTASHRTQARKRIIRSVEDAIQLKAKRLDDAEHLQTEFRERLDAPDLDDEIDTRPVAEIITDIIRDLGLAHMPGTHPWTRRTPRDLETLSARAAAPRPPGPYDPAPHGPDTGAPQSIKPPRDPDREYREMVQLAKQLSSA